MLQRVALVRTDVSEEPCASIIRVTANVVSSSPVLEIRMMEALDPNETAVLPSAPRCYIPEGGILYSHRRKILKSCIVRLMMVIWAEACSVGIVRRGGKANSVAFCPQRNYTDRLTATYRRSYCCYWCYCWVEDFVTSANWFPRPLITVVCAVAATFHSSSSSVTLTRLRGPRSRSTNSQKIEPGTSGAVARNCDH
jgi:hypothetical protein